LNMIKEIENSIQRSEPFKNMNINGIVTIKHSSDKLSKTYRWLCNYYSNYEMFKSFFESKKLENRYLPFSATCIKVDEKNLVPFDSHLYQTFPLKIATTLPFHINSNFILMNNRRGVLIGDPEIDQWNNILNQRIIPNSITQLILFTMKEMNLDSKSFYSLFPEKSRVSYLNTFITSWYKSILNTPILIGNSSNLISCSNAFIQSKNKVDKELLNILEKDGFVILDDIPEFISAKCDLKAFTAETLIKFYKKKFETLDTSSPHSYGCINLKIIESVKNLKLFVQFIGQKVSKEKLKHFPLPLFQNDEKFIIFSDQTLYYPNKIQNDFIPKSFNVFVDPSCKLQFIKEIDEKGILNLISSNHSEFKGKYQELWDFLVVLFSNDPLNVIKTIQSTLSNREEKRAFHIPVIKNGESIDLPFSEYPNVLFTTTKKFKSYWRRTTFQSSKQKRYYTLPIFLM
jgi:hypothetical protein